MTSLRLASGEAVKAFLLGRWALSKSFDYRTGGGRGALTGVATFTETSQRSGVLMYEERGMMELEGVAKPLEAYRRYCFNTNAWPVEVYFVDDPTKKHMASLIPELDVHTSFFVPLPFDEVASQVGECECIASFSHLCVDDTYSGALSVTGADAFDWNWNISGPNKDGDITCTFKRILASDSEA